MRSTSEFAVHLHPVPVEAGHMMAHLGKLNVGAGSDSPGAADTSQR